MNKAKKELRQPKIGTSLAEPVVENPAINFVKKPSSPKPEPLMTPQNLLQLQRIIGNKAIQRFLKQAKSQPAPMPSKPQVIERKIMAYSDKVEDIWETQIKPQLEKESNRELKEDIERLHSINSLIRVSGYTDLVERLEAGEFNHFLIASKKESPEVSLYNDSKVGGSSSGDSNWKTEGLTKEVNITKQKLNLPLFTTGHHKLPKSTIEWLYDHMSPQQWEETKAVLDLGNMAGLKSFKSLRSNITYGPDSGARKEDPGRGLDPNYVKDIKKKRRMSIRSSIYGELASYIAQIGGPPLATKEDILSEVEFKKIIGYFEQAEKSHALITKGGGLDSNIGMWQEVDKTAKPWQKQAMAEEPEIESPEKFVDTPVRDLKKSEHQGKFQNPPQLHWPLYVNIGIGIAGYKELMMKPDDEARRSEINKWVTLHILHRMQGNREKPTYRQNWHHGYQYLGKVEELGERVWQHKSPENELVYYDEAKNAMVSRD
jgi:hypothetical protein